MSYNNLEEYLVPASYFQQGGLWVWGYGFYGQLAPGTVDPAGKSSPVQTVSGGTNWKLISVGNYSVSAIKTDGTHWAWGDGTNGGLGNNNTANQYSPVQTVVAGTNWSTTSMGNQHCVATKTDGTLWTWGRNQFGQLGDNTVASKSSPIQTVSGGANWKSVSSGNSFMGAIKTDGTLWLWGRNDYGQLGDNTQTSRSSPVQSVSAGTNWRQLSCGWFHTSAIKTDGTLWTWGRNQFGQLGDNTIVNKSSPVQTISSGTNWKLTSSGASYATWHTAAIKTDGTLWLWGNNNYGQLGDNTRTSRSSPIQTITGGANWKQISANFRGTVGIKTDSRLWLWGVNSYGQLGDNTQTSRSSPVQTVSGGTNWKQVATGHATLAINGTWGTIT